MSLCMIGKIVAAHGIAGELRIQSYSDVPGRFKRLGEALIGVDEKTTQPWHIAKAQERNGVVILALQGLTTRNEAESLIGRYLYVTDDDMAAPPEGMHFIHDLIGCEVRLPDGTKRGTVTDVQRLPGQDLYVVEWNEMQYMVPAVPRFIKSVDIAAKTIIVDPIPGLLDDNDED